jgi:hypothetical protein
VTAVQPVPPSGTVTFVFSDIRELIPHSEAG